MRVQIEKCEQAWKDGQQDGFQSQHGFIPAFNIEGYCLDDVREHKVRAGDRLTLKGNFKKPPQAGTTEELQFKLKKDGSGRAISFPDGTHPDGSTLWRQVVERIPQNQRSGGQQNMPVNAQNRPQSGSNAGQAPKAVPTMSQAVAVLKECIDAVAALGGSDGHATTLFLARLRGDIRRDPSQAEVEAEAAAKAKAAEEAKKAAEAAAAEAARQAALAAMPAAEPTSEDFGIPF